MDKSCAHNIRGQEDLVALKGIQVLRGTVFPPLYPLGAKQAWPQISELTFDHKKNTENYTNEIKGTTGLTVNKA